MGEATDRELAGRVLAAGDEAAFRVLYRRHTPRLWPMLRRMLGDAGRPDAEDVVQEAWIRAVKALDGFRWEAAFSTWLTGIALNCAREQLRRRQRHGETWEASTVERVEAARRVGSADGGPARSDPAGRLDLERAIAALPDGYRTVLVLHDIEGFTHPEISDRLDIAVGTSRSQLYHARRAVRRALAPEKEATDA